MPLSAYYFGAGHRPNALLLGFGAVPPAAIRAAVTKLARVIEAVRTEA
jgi:DNA-binding transcriptional MocR family regulator